MITGSEFISIFDLISHEIIDNGDLRSYKINIQISVGSNCTIMVEPSLHFDGYMLYISTDFIEIINSKKNIMEKKWDRCRLRRFLGEEERFQESLMSNDICTTEMEHVLTLWYESISFLLTDYLWLFHKK